MSPTSPTAETLLAHAGWVRALARELTRDAVEAEELAQDALSAALGSREAARAPRAWLAALVRHRASRARRSSMRREAREHAAARPEAQPSAAELVARVDAHRALVDELRALDEPWRETLFLRWFEELPPRAIAARQRVPVATVHARLARGHELLRARLDRRAGGDRGAWLPAIAALALPAPPPAAGAALLGAVAMTKLGIGLACAAVVAALWLALRSSGATQTPPAERMAASAAAPADSNAAEIPVESAPLEERAALAAAPTTQDASADAAPPRPTALGRVLDVEGRPLAGVEISVHPPLEGMPPRVVSDADGRFELPRPEGYATRTVGGRLAGHTTVLVGELASSARELHVVLAPAIELGGRVVDADGEPLSGADVDLKLDGAVRAGLGLATERSREQDWSMRCDERGEFRFPAAPSVPGAWLTAYHEGAPGRVRVEAPRAPTLDLVLALEGRDLSTEVVTGRVLDEAGHPVADALVAGGRASCMTDTHGSFRLDREALGRSRRILAARAGSLPGHAEAEEDADGRFVWPEPLELRLGGPPLELRGRLLDERGEPVPGCDVGLADPEAALVAAHGWRGLRGASSHLESLLAGEQGDADVLTDDEGRFRLTGLLPREYTLQAYDLRTLRVARSAPVPAGTDDVVLRFEPLSEVAVAGRCLDRHGEPIADVSVSFGRRLEVRPRGSDASEWTGIFSLDERTDADGRFRIEGLPPEVDRVRYDGDAVLPDELELEPDAPRDALELVLPRRCHVQVEVSPRFAEATHFLALDADDRPLALVQFAGRSASSSTLASLHEGRSGVLAVSDAATAIVLGRGREEFARRELSLEPGEPTLVRFD